MLTQSIAFSRAMILTTEDYCQGCGGDGCAWESYFDADSGTRSWEPTDLPCSRCNGSGVSK